MEICKNGQVDVLGAWENLQPISQDKEGQRRADLGFSPEASKQTWRMHEMYVNLLDVCAA
jgi:hypothetical protein